MAGNFARLAATAAASLLLAGCDVIATGGAAAEPLDLQMAHPGGTVLQVLSASTGNGHTEVVLRIINGRDREIRLNGQREQTYLVNEAGEKLLLLEPAANPQLTVPSRQTIEGRLVFAGEMPRGSAATLVLNARTTTDNIHSASPRFETRIEPGALARSRDVPAASSLFAMRPNPGSQLAPRASGSATFGGGERSTSELRAVEALKTELGAVETDRGTLISLPGDVTFDFDKATIRPEARATLDRLAELIARSPEGTIAIEGHTDAVGADDYNQRLSERRAAAVADYLVSKNVARERLATRGWGKARPVASNTRPDGSDDEQGRQRNRRVEVVLPRGEGGTAGGESG